MADKHLPTPKELRQLLRYDPETGVLFWRKRDDSTASGKRFNKLRAGKKALTARQNGYCVGLVYRRNVSAHRVTWAIYHGEWPNGEIDHINGDRADNRISNLRDVSRVENARNQKRPVSNTSGVVGVCWNAGVGKWQASIFGGQKIKYLGVFDLFECAVEARKKAEKEYGFHANHGR
jgi:hypothetical protein